MSLPNPAEQGFAADCLQPPLLRRSGFRQRLKPGDKRTARARSLGRCPSAYRWLLRAAHANALTWLRSRSAYQGR